MAGKDPYRSAVYRQLYNEYKARRDAEKKISAMRSGGQIDVFEMLAAMEV